MAPRFPACLLLALVAAGTLTSSSAQAEKHAVRTQLIAPANPEDAPRQAPGGSTGHSRDCATTSKGYTICILLRPGSSQSRDRLLRTPSPGATSDAPVTPQADVGR